MRGNWLQTENKILFKITKHLLKLTSIYNIARKSTFTVYRKHHDIICINYQYVVLFRFKATVVNDPLYETEAVRTRNMLKKEAASG